MIKDILSYPAGALHTTKEVAEYLARKPRTIRIMAKMGRLKPKIRGESRLYFTTKAVRDWMEKAALFKSNRGAPRHLKKESGKV